MNQPFPSFTDNPAFTDNPVPRGYVEQPVRTDDGVTIRTAFWRPPGGGSGTVCLLHGRAETIEKYYEVAAELLARGLAVATFDWRGQGGSERSLANRLKGHVDDFAEYERDFAAFTQNVLLPDCPPPFFGLAHSTGGLVALRIARRSRTAFSRMVLTAPLLGLGDRGPPAPILSGAANLLTTLGMADAFVPRVGTKRGELGFDGNVLTSDERRYARMVAIGQNRPELRVGPPTIGWLGASLRAMAEARSPAFAEEIKIPTLIIAAGEDKVVSTRAIERFARLMRLGAQIVIPGSRHEIMMERDPIRALFWAAFDAFIPGSDD